MEGRRVVSTPTGSVPSPGTALLYLLVLVNVGYLF